MSESIERTKFFINAMVRGFDQYNQKEYELTEYDNTIILQIKIFSTNQTSNVRICFYPNGCCFTFSFGHTLFETDREDIALFCSYMNDLLPRVCFYIDHEFECVCIKYFLPYEAVDDHDVVNSLFDHYIDAKFTVMRYIENYARFVDDLVDNGDPVSAFQNCQTLGMI